MKFLLKDITIFRYKISFAALFWFTLALVAIIIQILKGAGSINNYLIFKGVFWHTLYQQNLYAEYVGEYFDSNHYGPFFSLIIAPFALMPNTIGCFLWGIANAAFLFYAVKQLPITETNKKIILLVAAVEMMTAMHNVQFNTMLTAWIVLSYTFVKREKDFWAALFIAAGIFTKLYGIVGLAFFLFSDHKIKFVFSFIFWSVLLFCLPMLISSPDFIIASYKNWYDSLMYKNQINAESTMQDMSVMRMIRNIFNVKNLSNIFVLVPVAIISLLPLLRFSQYKNLVFQLAYLAFLLIGVVIFSSSAESSTYIIAMTGVGIWYVLQNKPEGKFLKPGFWPSLLLIFAIVLTSLSTTDLFPDFIKVNFIRPYGLKALPCFIVWMVLALQLLKIKEIATDVQKH